MLSYSPFKINLYQTCPFKYKCVYIDKLADQYETPKPYLVMGQHVHNTLLDFYSGGYKKLSQIERRLRERWLENRDVFGGDREQENKWGSKALQMIRVFFASPQAKEKPVLLEDFYDMPLDKNRKLIGRIDRADKLSDGSLHVIDYKTGKYEPTDVSELQLKLYALIVQNKARAKVSRASYWYLYGNEWHTIDINETSLKESVAELHEKIIAIEADKEYMPRENKYCGHCDYKEICPIYKKKSDQ